MGGYLPKDYVGVHTRVEKFHAEHKENISIDTEFKLEGDVAIFKAVVKTSKGTFSGSSFGKLGKEKAFEKLETVAVGRALAFAGYEVKEGIASNEEMQVFQKNEEERKNKWLNYDDLVAISEAGNTTEADVAKVIKEDGYTLSKNAREAVRYYVTTGEIDKNLFFNK